MAVVSGGDCRRWRFSSGLGTALEVVGGGGGQSRWWSRVAAVGGGGNRRGRMSAGAGTGIRTMEVLKRSGDTGWGTTVKWLSGLSLCVCANVLCWLS